MGVLIPILSTIQKVPTEIRAIYVKADYQNHRVTEYTFTELKYSKKCQHPISTNKTNNATEKCKLKSKKKTSYAPPLLPFRCT